MSVEFISGEFRRAIVKWPRLTDPNQLQKISQYRITLRNLMEVKDASLMNNCYQGAITNGVQDLVKMASRDVNSIVIDNLIPDAFFSIYVEAIFINGQSKEVGYLSASSRVTSAPPASSPTDIKVKNLNDTAVLLTWKPPNDSSCTGELRRYTAILSTRSVVIDEREIDSSPNELIFNQLTPGSSYSIKMSAQTRAGSGPFSKSFNFKTTGSLPEQFTDITDEVYPDEEKLFLCHPLRVRVRSIQRNRDSLKLHWDLEDYRIQSRKNNDLFNMKTRPKDCEKFPDSEILIKWDRTNDLSLTNTRAIDSNEKTFIISHLKPETEYYVRISSMLNGKETYPFFTIVNTDPQDESLFNMTYPSVDEVESDSATISWSSRDVNNYRGYLVKLYLANPEADLIDSGVTIKNIFDPEQTTLTLKNLKASKVYKFSVCRVAPDKDFNSPIDDRLCTKTQTFETFGSKPLKKLKNIAIFPNDMEQSTRDAIIEVGSIPTTCTNYGQKSTPLRLTWSRDDNDNVENSYEIYLSGDPRQPHDKWFREIVNNHYNGILFRSLQPDCTYYLHISLVNLYGNGPLSLMHSFRTPNEYGIGGGIISTDHLQTMYTKSSNDMTIHPWNMTLTEVDLKFDGGSSYPNLQETSSDDFKWLIVGCISGLVLLMIIVVSLVHIIKYIIKSKNIQMAMDRDIKSIHSNGHMNTSNMMNTPNSMDYLSCTVQKPQSINTSGFHSCSLLNNVESHSQVLNSTGRSSEISYPANNSTSNGQCRNLLENDVNNQYRVTPVESESSFGFNTTTTQNSTRRNNFTNNKGPFYNDYKRMSPQMNLLHDCEANARSSLSAGLNSLDVDTIGQTSYHQQSPKNLQIMSNSLFYQNQYPPQQQNKIMLMCKNSDEQIAQGSSVSPTSSFTGIYRDQFGSFGRCSTDENRNNHSPNQFSNVQSPVTSSSRKIINNHHRAYPKPVMPSILTSKTYSCNMNENLTSSDSKMSSFKPYVTPSTPRVNATHLHSPAESKSSIGYETNQIVNCTSSSGMGESPAPGDLSTTPQISSNSSAIDEPNSRKYLPTKLIEHQKNVGLMRTDFNLNQPGLQKGFSTEELSVEMANLEGLMKDLSEITNKEFKC